MDTFAKLLPKHAFEALVSAFWLDNSSIDHYLTKPVKTCLKALKAEGRMGPLDSARLGPSVGLPLINAWNLVAASEDGDPSEEAWDSLASGIAHLVAFNGKHGLPPPEEGWDQDEIERSYSTLVNFLDRLRLATP